MPPAVALVLGSPGNDPQQGFDQPDLPKVRSDWNYLQDFLARNDCKVLSGTACDTDFDRYNCLDRIGEFLSAPAATFFLGFLGDGREGDGAWVFGDDVVLFDDIAKLWDKKHGDDQAKLLIYSDSCYSGCLCSRAKEHECMRICVQASSAGDELSSDGCFTQIWIRAQEVNPEEDVGMREMMDQNSQHPDYYCPDGRFQLGKVMVRFLPSPIDSTGSKSLWQSYRDNFDDEQLRDMADAMAARPGWASDTRLVEILQKLAELVQEHPTRGSAAHSPSDEIVSFFKDQLRLDSITLQDLLSKFEGEFF